MKTSLVRQIMSVGDGMLRLPRGRPQIQYSSTVLLYTLLGSLKGRDGARSSTPWIVYDTLFVEDSLTVEFNCWSWKGYCHTIVDSRHGDLLALKSQAR